MPLYAIECECGSDEGFDTIADKEAQAGKVRCLDCHELRSTHITPVKSINVWPEPRFVAQVGREFSSQKELDSYCEEKGLEYHSRSSKTWKDFYDKQKEHADTEAQEAGFVDAEDRKTFVKKNQRDLVASNRQRQIDEYHDKHGSDGKQTVEEAFGELPTQS